MKYYVIESTICDNQQANAITVRDTLDAALMVYHQIRASALANMNVTYNLTMIVNERGAVYVCEHHGETEKEENTINSDMI